MVTDTNTNTNTNTITNTNTNTITNTNVTEEYNKYKLFVFDLDNTLYLHEISKEKREEYEIRLKKMLRVLKKNGKKIGLASFNSNPNKFLIRMDIMKYFDVIIGEYPIGKYSRDKLSMIHEIMDKTDSCNNETVFFDDLYSNIHKVKQDDIKCIYVIPFIGIEIDEIINENAIEKEVSEKVKVKIEFSRISKRKFEIEIEFNEIN